MGNLTTVFSSVQYDPNPPQSPLSTLPLRLPSVGGKALCFFGGKEAHEFGDLNADAADVFGGNAQRAHKRTRMRRHPPPIPRSLRKGHAAAEVVTGAVPHELAGLRGGIILSHVKFMQACKFKFQVKSCATKWGLLARMYAVVRLKGEGEERGKKREGTHLPPLDLDRDGPTADLALLHSLCDLGCNPPQALGRILLPLKADPPVDLAPNAPSREVFAQGLHRT